MEFGSFPAMSRSATTVLCSGRAAGVCMRTADAGPAPLMRKKWKWKERSESFQDSLGRPRYTMQWNARLEKIYGDPNIPMFQRLCAYVDRKSNGHLSHCAVTCLPKVDSDDPVPQKITQAYAGRELGVSQSSISAAAKQMRERGLLLPNTEGYFYPNHCVEGELFEASLRENPAISPLESSEASGGQNLLPYLRYREQWLAGHPEVAKREAGLRQQREELKERVRDLSDEINEIGRDIMTDWRSYQRKAARASVSVSLKEGAVTENGVDLDSNPPLDSANADNTTAGGVVSDSCDEPSTTPHTTNVHKRSAINETDDISSKEKEPPRRRHDVGTSTAAHDDAGSDLSNLQDAEEEPGPAAAPPLTAATFHADLARAFRAASKPVPTRIQSDPQFIHLGDLASAFLGWLADYRKLPAIKHPGVLPALVAEFDAWHAAEPPPAPVHARCPRCGSSDVESQVWDGNFVARCRRCSNYWYGKL